VVAEDPSLGAWAGVSWEDVPEAGILASRPGGWAPSAL